MSNEKVVWEAEFNPAVKMYWLLSGALVCVFTIVGIVFLPVWLIVGSIITGKYLASHKCTLTNRSLKFSKGVLVRQEKTVPLDRITDVGLTQGPIMRAMDIEALSVETAGQSSVGSLISLAGIKDGRKFRDAVLKQRDLVVGSDEIRSESAPAHTSAPAAGNNEVLEQIRDTLVRIEAAIKETR